MQNVGPFSCIMHYSHYGESPHDGARVVPGEAGSLLVPSSVF